MMSNKVLRIVFIISAITGFAAVFLFRRNLSAEASMVNYFGALPKEFVYGVLTPDTAKEIFAFPLAGFIYFDFFDIVNVVLLILLFLPVLYLFYKKSKMFSLTVFFLLVSCLIFYIISNIAFPVYRNLHKPEKLIAIFENNSIRVVLSYISVFLFYLCGLFITILIKKFCLFSKYTFIFGLLTNIIGLLYFPLALIIGEYNFIAIVLAAPFTVIWHSNIALNLLKLRKGKLDFLEQP